MRADVAAASIAAQGVSKRTLGSALRPRFEKMAAAGEFELGDLELLSLASLAAQEAKQAADRALAKGANTKVPLAIIKEAANVEHRMQSACEHTLIGIDAAKVELERLSPGTGYRDLADDLVGYADLYEAHPAEVQRDGMNYVATDAAAARKLARKIYDALGGDLTPRDQAALDLLGRAWTFLLEVYERVAVIGRFLLRNADADTAFPSLFVAGRPRVGRPKKTAPAPAPEPAPAPAPPPPAVAAPPPPPAPPAMLVDARPARGRHFRHGRR
jgi:hypothetical protein